MNKADLHLPRSFATQSESMPKSEIAPSNVISIRVAGLNPGRFYRLSGKRRTFFRADQAGVVEIQFCVPPGTIPDLISVV